MTIDKMDASLPSSIVDLPIVPEDQKFEDALPVGTPRDDFSTVAADMRLSFGRDGHDAYPMMALMKKRSASPL